MASELYWVNVVGDAGYWQAGGLRTMSDCLAIALSGGNSGHLPWRASAATWLMSSSLLCFGDAASASFLRKLCQGCRVAVDTGTSELAGASRSML